MKASDDKKKERQAWVKPTMTPVGTIGNVLRGGGGKNSPSPADPGDIRKPSGQH